MGGLSVVFLLTLLEHEPTLYLSEIRQRIEDVAGFEVDTSTICRTYKGYTGRGRLYKMSLHSVAWTAGSTLSQKS